MKVREAKDMPHLKFKVAACLYALGQGGSGSEIRYSTSRLAEEMSPAASGPAGGEIFFKLRVN